MDTQTKSPIEIVGELLAIHATRKEACDKFSGAEDAAEKLIAASRQSDEFIAELMSELSNYGDGVPALAERENEYQTIYKNALAKVDTMPPPERAQIFHLLEDSMKNIYQQLLHNNTSLPESLHEIITAQAGKL